MTKSFLFLAQNKFLYEQTLQFYYIFQLTDHEKIEFTLFIVIFINVFFCVAIL